MEMKITNYIIAESTRKEELEKDIQDLISKGWEPYGSLSFVEYLNYLQSDQIYCRKYCQAMVYKENMEE